MNTLIIFAHPNHDGHHGYFLSRLQEQLASRQIEFELLDLYADSFDPRISKEELHYIPSHRTGDDVLVYQKKIKAANRLIFVYPTWWQGCPAIMKGFFDRVFSSHFAFMYKNGLPVGLLKGKKAAVFSAAGGPSWYNKLIIREKGLKVVINNTLKFCGIKAKGFSLGSMRTLDEQVKVKLDRKVRALLTYLY
jgi:NAD(P)H dehydrogenase (quinone)